MQPQKSDQYVTCLRNLASFNNPVWLTEVDSLSKLSINVVNQEFNEWNQDFSGLGTELEIIGKQMKWKMNNLQEQVNNKPSSSNSTEEISTMKVDINDSRENFSGRPLIGRDTKRTFNQSRRKRWRGRRYRTRKHKQEPKPEKADTSMIGPKTYAEALKRGI